MDNNRLQVPHPGPDEMSVKPDSDSTKFNAAVYKAIARFRDDHPSSFGSSDRLDATDQANLLRIVVDICSSQTSMTEWDCAMHLREHVALPDALDSAFASGVFTDVIEHPDMPLLTFDYHKAGESGTPASGDHPSLKSAFEVPYVGEAHKLFIETLNAQRSKLQFRLAVYRPYSWSITVVQSSGMGKSRMVDEAAKIMFTIPINLQRKLPPGRIAFPPPDTEISKFFEKRHEMGDAKQRVDYAVFLGVLFKTTLEVVERQWPSLYGQDLAWAWAKHLKEGLTEEEAGHNQRRYFNAVVEKAENLCQRCTSTTSLGYVTQRLESSCRSLMKRLVRNSSVKNVCLVSFDEAPELNRAVETPTDEHQHNPWHNLGTVLSFLDHEKVFFIFLSTNSNLKGVAPPVIHYPGSNTLSHGGSILPPFNELPMNLFLPAVLEGKTTLTLEDMCSPDMMVGLGRALWYTEYKIHSGGIFRYAMEKLCGSGVNAHESDSILAALAVRINISFRGIHHEARSLESRLVESHLRVVYVIPWSQEYMHTGSSSEPVVAEAAGLYLNEGESRIETQGLQAISSAFRKALLPREECEGLVGRLIVTVAHDLALRTIPNLSPRYHRPIPVLEFLCALLHLDYHGLVLNAKPINQSTGSVTLREAFKNSFVFFSHFGLTNNSDALKGRALAAALLRGMALQVSTDEEYIDAVIPVHMGATTDPITAKTTSAINLKFNNYENITNRKTDRRIIVPNVDMPVISMVFELGFEEHCSEGVSVVNKPHTTTCARATNKHHNNQHYPIVARGCRASVFAAIPSETEERYYRGILRGHAVLDDFPRNGCQENVDRFWSLNVGFDGKRQADFYSKFWPGHSIDAGATGREHGT